ncbi:hypothetical protein MTO96_027054 [Rhipicephalus appendiculatus]
MHSGILNAGAAATESNARAAVLRASADGRAGGVRSVESENDPTTPVTSQPVAACSTSKSPTETKVSLSPAT